jgi:GNAT superfamily N-acetyltransferase
LNKAREWYEAQPWLVGCNFIPSTAINQLEMWQADTYDPSTIEKELTWAETLGFNVLRVYLHDLVWAADSRGFSERIDDFLGIAKRHGMRALLVLFDDCHRPDPELGTQPLPVAGVHNSGWKHSPGQKLVLQFHEGTVTEKEKARLENYVKGMLTRFAKDERVLMWDVYNEPGQSGNGDKTHELLKEAWQWAQQARPSQPLTACLDGSTGKKNVALNAAKSDIITFHCYWGPGLEKTLRQHKDGHSGRPILCTEYMARELGTTFRHSLPIFKRHRVGCLNWGLVAGKSQTHWNWETVRHLADLREKGVFLRPGDPIPEPPLWFHDIFRVDGTPFDPEEIESIRGITKPGRRPPATGALQEKMNDSVSIAEATPDDAEAILALQRAAYQREAVLHDDFDIPPLTQTLRDIRKTFGSHVFLKALCGDTMVGSVRASCEDGTCYIGRLIVHPDWQRKGIGSRLLEEIEHRFSDARRFELFTGHKSHDNLRFYAAKGYTEFDRRAVSDRLTLVYLEKKRHSD